jgi:hypothetical protein
MKLTGAIAVAKKGGGGSPESDPPTSTEIKIA